MSPKGTDESVFVQHLMASYLGHLHAPLVPAEVRPEKAADWLYRNTIFAVLAHNAANDPVFVYANLCAQHCFEMSWQELIGMPSRLSADTPDRAERAATLAQVAAQGYTTHYRGLRIAKSGRRFWIERGILWNVLDDAGVRIGQGAMFCPPSLEKPPQQASCKTC
jgi:MEKHLA domain